MELNRVEGLDQVRTSFEIRSLRGRAAALAVVTIAALMSPLLATTATATVVGACGAVIPIAAPKNLAEGGVETTGLVHAFVERNGLRLSFPLTTDAVKAGTYTKTSSLPSPAPKIAAGTVVDSYMLHSDPLGKPTALQGNRFSVRVSFDSDILGVMVTDSSLNGSDGTVGVHGAIYPTFAHRGLELMGNPFNDHFTISTNRHTIQVFFSTSTYVDEVRVVVAHTAASFSQAYGITNVNGQVINFGPRAVLGNAPRNLASPINAASETCTGQGYWLGAADGGIFSFGDAKFFGSMGAIHLNQPIVGMAATPTGAGYWLVASDGGIFSFGDAKFYGSMGGEAPEPADRRHGATADGQGLLAGRSRRRHLQLRRRQVLRLDGRHAPEPTDRRHGRDTERPRLLAGREQTAASSASATPSSSARWAARS